MPDIYSRFTSEALFTMRSARDMLEVDNHRQILPEHVLRRIMTQWVWQRFGMCARNSGT